MTKKGFNDKDKKKKGEKEMGEKENTENTVVSEELVKWMTEGTNPNVVPRSDCG